jgi:hypothetical protein
VSISQLHDEDLRPRILKEPSKGDGGTWLNADAAISMLRKIDTEKARRTYRAYLKHRRTRERRGEVGADARGAALMDAIREMGGKLVPHDLTGKPFNVWREQT